MKKISINIPAEMEEHITFMHEYIKEQTTVNFTKTQIILYAIEYLYSECWNEKLKSNKKNT